MDKHFNKLLTPWTLKDTYIERGTLFKKKIPLKQIENIDFFHEVSEHDKSCYMTVFARIDGHIKSFELGYPLDDEGEKALKYILVKCPTISKERKQEILSKAQHKRHELELALYGLKSDLNSYLDAQLQKGPKEQKDASVVGRAVVGGVIAGPAGAIVGALSAVDKNNKNNKNNK